MTTPEKLSEVQKVLDRAERLQPIFDVALIFTMILMFGGLLLDQPCSTYVTLSGVAVALICMVLLWLETLKLRRAGRSLKP